LLHAQRAGIKTSRKQGLGMRALKISGAGADAGANDGANNISIVAKLSGGAARMALLLFWALFLAGALIVSSPLAFLAAPAMAQQARQDQTPAPKNVTAGKAVSQTPSHAANNANGGSESDAQKVVRLEKRVRELERQIIDLRAMIGTFASLRAGLASQEQAGQMAGMAGNEQMAGHVASGATGPGAGASGAAGAGRDNPGFSSSSARLTSPYGRPQRDNMGAGDATSVHSPPPADGALAQGAAIDAGATPGGAGSTSKMAAAGASEINARNGAGGATMEGMAGMGGMTGSSAAAASSSAQALKAPVSERETRNDDDLYRDAYGHMLRRDYASAEKAFASLVRLYPKSRMAGSSQYWLGETFYVRGKYRRAADAFLKSIKNYPNGVKAPDSFMKLALSLSRLGQRDAACRAFAELEVKYPNAPAYILRRAAASARRAGCN
jgi:tol-pal system protein YbgF